MKSLHDRLYVPGVVSLIKGKVRNDYKLVPQEEIEELMEQCQFLKDAPFLWVGMVFLYGLKNDLKVVFKRINKTYGDLPISMELSMEVLRWADQNNLDLLRDIYMIASLDAMIQVGQKYKLPIEVFVEMRSHYGAIPNTIEECHTYPRKH